MGPEINFLDRPSTNEVPSENEFPQIRLLRQECRAGIDAIDKKIKGLIRQRKLLEEDLERYDSLLSPVKWVPDDVLSTIFEISTITWHQQIDNLASTQSERIRQNPPTIIASQICKRWRQLALATPKLWATIYLVPPSHPRMNTWPYKKQQELDAAERMWEAKMKQLLEIILPLWIERSKQQPLSVVFRLMDINNGTDNEWDGDATSVATSSLLYTALVNLACTVAHRWKEIDLDLYIHNIPAVVTGMLVLAPGDVPRLETISLQTNDLRQQNPSFAPQGLFMGQSLRSLSLIRIYGPWAQLSVNWEALKELSVGVKGAVMGVAGSVGSSIERVLGPCETLLLLRMCPNLEHCEISVTSIDKENTDWQAAKRSEEEHGKSVRHSRLRSLRFHGSLPSVDLLSCLDLPSLQALHFLGLHLDNLRPEHRRVQSQRLLNAINRFGSQLTDLRFNLLVPFESSDAVVSCFQNLPHLFSLHLGGTAPKPRSFRNTELEVAESTANFLLNLLTPEIDDEGRPYGSMSCPNLKRFVSTPMIKGFTEGQLLEFITRRSLSPTTSHIARIEQVDVALGVPRGMDIRSELKLRGVDVDRLMLRIQYVKRT
ncbi:hypothetical protein FA13DRAFT_1815981 [Coprinellus micaceus]|uniref:Uncharacterized protein n=1 Tax=Coprinellus micaceus TaxID=71717 RepID=A0A4Y7T2M0_COPMI|nr:hypothetical protein FA13DRAFT_1815981 [Coprinellus micaceus]